MSWTRFALDQGEKVDTIGTYSSGDETYLPLHQMARALGVPLTLERDRHGRYCLAIMPNEGQRGFGQIFSKHRKDIQDSLQPQVQALSDLNQRIFSHPEAGNEEFDAAATITDFLTRIGFTVTCGLPGVNPINGENVFLDTAFKAVIKGKAAGPVLCIMLEYDALPMGHACGHNLIAVSGLAAAAGLAPLMARTVGELWVIGTPAEEGGKYGGKIPLLKAGHFDGSDIVLITHPGDRWDTGADFLAISGGRFTFSSPPSFDSGISALDAAVLAYTNIEMIREHTRPDTRIHGIVKEGGTAVGRIPHKAVLSYAVRALDQPYVEVLKCKIEQCVKAAADAVGADVQIAWSYGYSAPINVPLLDSLVLSAAKEAGTDGIKKWEALGSSDLGNVGYEIPTCNLWFKIAPEGILPHTHEFMKAAGSMAGFQSALKAGLILAESGMAMFENPQIIQSIADDFRHLKNILIGDR